MSDRSTPLPSTAARHLLVRVALGMGVVAHVDIAVHEEPLFPDEGQKPEIRLPACTEWAPLIRSLARLDFDSITETEDPASSFEN